MNLRRAAQGRDCQLREPGVCNFDPETVVLAHLRYGNVAGRGQKPDDAIAVLACSACHDALDGRTKHRIPERHILDAWARTLTIWRKEGLL